MMALPLDDARRLGLRMTRTNAARDPLTAVNDDDLKLVDAKGTKHSLREFAGRPHVVILIKGAFCKLCMGQLSELQKRLESSKIPIVVITPVDDLPELAGLPFSVFADKERSVFRKLKAFDTEPLHATYVFGAKGEVLLKDVGPEPYADFAAIEKVLNIKSVPGPTRQEISP